jgi:hypothetical protein
MYNELKTIAALFKAHKKALLAIVLVCALAFFLNWYMEVLAENQAVKMQVLSSTKSLAPSPQESLLPNQIMKDWILGVVTTAVDQKVVPVPKTTFITNTISVPSPAPAAPTAPPIVNNYYNYPATIINNVNSPAPAVAASSNTSITSDTSLTGGLSVAGLVTLNGGLDLADSVLTANNLSFALPSISDTLAGVSDTETFTNKTISGISNAITDIPNTATTATAANTINSIVTRDANGDFSAGTITANLTGNADTATNAITATVATTADAVTNGLYSTGNYSDPTWLSGLAWNKLLNTPTSLSGYGITDPVVLTSSSYTNPAWITSLDGSKLTGTITANAIHAGTYTIGIAGNATTVTNGLYSTGSYINPGWLASLDGSKLTGTVTANALAAGTYAANISGNAATATLANTATTASAVLNGVYTNGSYNDPSWITNLNGNKLTGTVTATAITPGTYSINIGGDAATADIATVATTATNAINANAVTNGLYSTGTYSNPSWLTSLDGSKLTGTVTATALASGNYGIGISGNAATATLATTATNATSANTVINGVYTTGTYNDPSWIIGLNGNKLTGTVTANALANGSYAVNITGNATTATSAASASLAATATSVTNGIYTTGSYSNPTWLTGLVWSKISSTPTSLAGYGITDPIVLTNGSYTNPAWITSLDGSKLTGIVTANALAAGTYAANISGNAATATLANTASSATNASTVTNGIYTTGSYINPSWLSSLDGSKLTGTITANAIASGNYAIGITGNAATVTNGLYSTGTYSNPSWLTGITWSKISSTPTSLAGYGITDPVVLTSSSYTNPSWISSLDGSKLTGTVTANALASGTYSIGISGNAATATFAASATAATNAATVTNGLYSTGSYANPSWLTSLDGSKLTGTVTASAIAAGTYGISITGNAASVTNGLYSTGNYANPSWISSLDGGKLTGTITATAITAGTYAVNVTGNAGTVTNGLYSTSTYTNPAWLTSLDGSKLTGTVTANALAAGDYAVNNLTTANTVVASGSLANTLLSGTCVVNTNAATLVAFQSSATITTSQIFYNSTRSRHSRITSVSTCTDSSSNQWRVLTLTDSITGSTSGDSYTVYNPTGSIGNTAGGFFNNLFAINLKGIVSTLSGGFDVAEEYQTNDTSIESGDVIVLDPSNPGFITKSSTPYQSSVMGIVTTNPGLTLGDETVGTWRKIALNGHVPVKVSTENGPIAIGDFLTTSSVPGIAMKATEDGTVIGKAMDNYSGDGVGVIPVFVSIGSYTAPHVSITDITQSIQDGGVTIDSKVLFNGGIVTDTIASSGDSLQIQNDTVFIGRPYFNTDTAGFIIIQKGETEQSLTYDTPYYETPIVNATITENSDDTTDVNDLFANDIQYAITDNNANGFSIVINKAAPDDIRFSWTAFMVKNAKTTTDTDTDTTQSSQVTQSPVTSPVVTDTDVEQSPEADTAPVAPPVVTGDDSTSSPDATPAIIATP